MQKIRLVDLIKLNVDKEFIGQFKKQYGAEMDVSLEALEANREVDFDGLIRAILRTEEHWQFLAERFAVFEKVPIQLGCICIDNDPIDYCNKRFMAEEIDRNQLLFPIYVKYLDVIAAKI